MNESDGFVDKRETPARERELERNVSKIKNYDIEMLIWKLTVMRLTFGVGSAARSQSDEIINNTDWTWEKKRNAERKYWMTHLERTKEDHNNNEKNETSGKD